MQTTDRRRKPHERATLYAVARPRLEGARHATAQAALRSAYRGHRRLAVQYVRLTIQMDTILETPDAPNAEQWVEILRERERVGAEARRG